MLAWQHVAVPELPSVREDRVGSNARLEVTLPVATSTTPYRLWWTCSANGRRGSVHHPAQDQWRGPVQDSAVNKSLSKKPKLATPIVKPWKPAQPAKLQPFEAIKPEKTDDRRLEQSD